MALAGCARCGKLFEKRSSAICPLCQPDEDADYEKVRNELSRSPNLSAKQLAESTGVDMNCILRFLEEGRIAATELIEVPRCGRCGAPAISLSKRLCQACLNRLNAQVAAAQAKAKKAQAKKSPQDTTSSISETVEKRRRLSTYREKTDSS